LNRQEAERESICLGVCLGVAAADGETEPMTTADRRANTRPTKQLDPKKLLSEVTALRRQNAALPADQRREGKWSEPGGLVLKLKPNGRAYFVHFYRFGGRDCERVLGDYPEQMVLSEARRQRNLDKTMLPGVNPKAHYDAIARATMGSKHPTFSAYALAHTEFLAAGLKSEGAKSTWLRQITGAAKKGCSVGHLASMPMDRITMQEVIKVIRPLWFTSPFNAERLSARIAAVWDHWQVNSAPDDDRKNPADWGRLQRAVGVECKHVESHHPALPHEQAPEFMLGLQKRLSMSARCLEMVIASGCRVGEITELRREEIDRQRGVMVIPAERMKTQHHADEPEPHVVPLSRWMLQILDSVQPLNGQTTGLVFPAPDGQAYWPKSILMNVRALKAVSVKGEAATTHGFRSTIHDWGTSMPHGEHAPFEIDLMETVLAHKLRGETCQAYQRDRWVERRRVVMEQWGRFCAPWAYDDDAAAAPPPSNVVSVPVRFAA
jgi:integrase